MSKRKLHAIVDAGRSLPKKSSFPSHRAPGRARHRAAMSARCASYDSSTSDIVGGVATLHNFPKQSLSVNRHPVSMPEYTSGTSHYVAPADFATIYNLYKGTSSQAVQNLNLMFGLDESLGLPG